MSQERKDYADDLSTRRHFPPLCVLALVGGIIATGPAQMVCYVSIERVLDRGNPIRFGPDN
jgi:hypothetical protein